MPVKGWVNFTVREEVAELLNQYSKETGESVSSLLTEFAHLFPKLRIVQIFDEEQLKEAVQQALYTIEAVTKFIKIMEGAPTQGLLRKEEVFTVKWFMDNLPTEVSQKFVQEYNKLLLLKSELKAEREKLSRILYKISPEKPSSYPIALPPIPVNTEIGFFIIEEGAPRWLPQAKHFISLLEYCFGADFERVKKVRDALITLRDKGLELEWTIDVLDRAYRQLLEMKKSLGVEGVWSIHEEKLA